MFHRGMPRRKRLISFSCTVSIVVVLASLLTLSFHTTIRAQKASDPNDGIGALTYENPMLGITGLPPQSTHSQLTYSTTSFTSNGQTYPFSMLGHNPTTNTSTT